MAHVPFNELVFGARDLFGDRSLALFHHLHRYFDFVLPWDVFDVRDLYGVVPFDLSWDLATGLQRDHHFVVVGFTDGVVLVSFLHIGDRYGVGLRNLLRFGNLLDLRLRESSCLVFILHVINFYRPRPFGQFRLECAKLFHDFVVVCLLYTSPSPRD